MKISVLLVSIIISLPVFAYACTGKVDRVQLTGAGSVEIISSELYGNSTGHTICNLSTVWKDVTVESCKGWYSLILSSIAQNVAIKIQYTTTACENVGEWSNANPPHMLSDI
jgi:hypothetical protein